MKKFAAGFITCWYVWKYRDNIVDGLDKLIAKLELRHENRFKEDES